MPGQCSAWALELGELKRVSVVLAVIASLSGSFHGAALPSWKAGGRQVTCSEEVVGFDVRSETVCARQAQTERRNLVSGKGQVKAV